MNKSISLPQCGRGGQRAPLTTSHATALMELSDWKPVRVSSRNGVAATRRDNYFGCHSLCAERRGILATNHEVRTQRRPFADGYAANSPEAQSEIAGVGQHSSDACALCFGEIGLPARRLSVVETEQGFLPPHVFDRRPAEFTWPGQSGVRERLCQQKVRRAQQVVIVENADAGRTALRVFEPCCVVADVPRPQNIDEVIRTSLQLEDWFRKWGGKCEFKPSASAASSVLQRRGM